MHKEPNSESSKKKKKKKTNKIKQTNKNSTLNRFEINFFDSESDEERGRFWCFKKKKSIFVRNAQRPGRKIMGDNRKCSQLFIRACVSNQSTIHHILANSRKLSVFANRCIISVHWTCQMQELQQCTLAQLKNTNT